LLRKKSLVFLASLVGTVVLVESLVRVRQWWLYGSALTTFYRLDQDPASGLRIPRPLDHVGSIHVNSLGFRGPEIEQPKPVGRVRVAFLGGSTTFCGEASSFQATWPARVVASLAADAPDLAFDLVNAGGPGYSTAESLRNLQFRVAPLQPDLIVIYHGTNDLTADTRRLALAQGLYESESASESVGEYWLTYHLISKNLKYLFRTSERAVPRLTFEPRALSAPFHERLRALVTRSQAVAPLVCLVTFSTRIRDGQPTELQRAAAASALYYMPFLDVPGLLAGYQEYNRVVREVARETGALLVEGEDAIPGDFEHFTDSVHFQDAGSELQAARVVLALLSSPAYRQWLEAHRRALKN